MYKKVIHNVGIINENDSQFNYEFNYNNFLSEVSNIVANPHYKI